MVSTLTSFCELLSSREYDCSAFSLYQGRTEICDTLLQAEGLQGAEIHMHLCTVWGHCCFLGKCVNRREVFMKSQTNVSDEECSGCPSTRTSNKGI